METAPIQERTASAEYAPRYVVLVTETVRSVVGHCTRGVFWARYSFTGHLHTFTLLFFVPDNGRVERLTSGFILSQRGNEIASEFFINEMFDSRMPIHVEAYDHERNTKTQNI